MSEHRQAAPDYTAAFLVTSGILVFVALVALWAGIGLLAALLAAYASDRAVAGLGAAGTP